MKKSARALFAILWGLNGFAQNQNWCGTVFTEEAEQLRLKDSNSTASKLEADTPIYYIPVYPILFGESDGTGYISRHHLLNAFNDLNTQFAYNDTRLRFYISGKNGYITKDQDIRKVPSSYFYNGSYSNRSELYSFNAPDVCNTYFLGQGQGFCGRSNLASEFGGIELVNGCVDYAGSNTFSHEMGHWLNLNHTFDGNACDECLDGSNCLNCGDGFCDTPADYFSNGFSCFNPPFEPDRCNSGLPINPDGRLSMSYSNGCDYYYFSNEQIYGNSKYEGMRKILLGPKRNFLLNFPEPPHESISGVPDLKLPANKTIIEANNYTMQWSSIAGASMYYLMVSRSAFFSSGIVVDKFVSDTSYTLSSANILIDMDTGRYYWRVRPFNPVYTATSYSVTDTFINSTKLEAGFTAVADNLMFSSFQLYPNPVSEKEFYVNVNSDRSLSANGAVYNLSGQLIQSENFYFNAGSNQRKICLVEQLPAGIYFFHLTTGHENFIQKLVVME